MTSKDVKGLLKEAREAIKNKDFRSVIPLCKSILQNDKDNYMAQVFFGLSVQEVGPTEQAPIAFRKAIQINPAHVLAWNGLANYYEKVQSENGKKELVEVYLSLLQIETNDKKLIELCEKLSSLPIDLEQVNNIIEVLTKLAQNHDSSVEIKSAALTTIASIASQLTDFPTHLNSVYEEALRFVLNDTNLTTRKYYSEYLILLYKGNKYELLVEEAEKMYTLYIDDLTPLEWICKVYNELVIEGIDIWISKDKIQNYCGTLLNLQSNSSMGLFAKAVLLYQNKQIVECKEVLDNVCSLRTGLLHAWYLLATCYLSMQIYEAASDAGLKADKLLKSINNSNKILRKQVDIVLMESLSRHPEDDSLKKGVELCKQQLDEDYQNAIALSCLIRCFINSQNYSQAKEYLSKFNDSCSSDAFSLLTAQMLHKEGNVKKAQELLQAKKDITLSDWWFEIGVIYWEQEQFEKSLIPFLNAAKLNTNSFLYFLYLGHYYQKFGDLNKARRCYEKSFGLNKKCIEAATELSKIYRLQKNWEANVLLLQNLSGDVLQPENLWAWVQLGLSYLEQEEYASAIDTLQYVVRANPTNNHCWECLADAYMARGAYTSALKCYEKAAELTPNSLYPLLQMAVIKQKLGQFADSRTDFEAILMINNSYVPALKGLAETCVQQARQYCRDQLMGLARSSAQHALDMLTVAIQQRNDLSCLWKLAGDSCLLVTKLPEKYCCLLVLAALAEGQLTEGNKILEQEDLFILAERCYSKALTLIENNTVIWCDLATCFVEHAAHCKNVDEAEKLYQKSTTIIQHCITVDASNWKYWNLLGVIAVKQASKNYALAQHSFIKAVIAENNSAVAWCNLGTMYLILKDHKLANNAFSQAQRSDPNYVNSWVGQALLADYLGMDDAMDLFRHSTQLGVQREGSIGYGHWVITTLLKAPPHAVMYSIHNMHAVPTACDALTWYTENNPDNPCAWNMLGLFRERMGLKTSSAQAFRNALRFCSKSQMDQIRINYGRLLFKLKKYPEAVAVYRDIQEASFKSGSGLALALFKDQQYEESYETYEQALHWLTDEQGFQSDLLVALASMAYTFQGPDAAKTLLFQSIQLKPPSLFGLYATLALGLLHKDINLALLVLKELQNFKDDPECLPHYAILLSYTYLFEGKHTTAVRELSKLIHRHPSCTSIWLTLAILLVRLHKNSNSLTTAAAKCAQAAIKMGKTNLDVTKVFCVLFMASFLTEDHEQALKVAQKAVHCYPDSAEMWTTLITVVQHQKTELCKLSTDLWLEKSVTHIVTNLNPSPPLLEWLSRHKC